MQKTLDVLHDDASLLEMVLAAVSAMEDLIEDVLEFPYNHIVKKWNPFVNNLPKTNLKILARCLASLVEKLTPEMDRFMGDVKLVCQKLHLDIGPEWEMMIKDQEKEVMTLLRKLLAYVESFVMETPLESVMVQNLSALATFDVEVELHTSGREDDSDQGRTLQRDTLPVAPEVLRAMLDDFLSKARPGETQCCYISAIHEHDLHDFDTVGGELLKNKTDSQGFLLADSH